MVSQKSLTNWPSQTTVNCLPQITSLIQPSAACYLSPSLPSLHYAYKVSAMGMESGCLEITLKC